MAAHYIVVKHIPLVQYISEYLGLAPSFSFLPFSFFAYTPLCQFFHYIILRTKSTQRLVHVHPCSLCVYFSITSVPLPHRHPKHMYMAKANKTIKIKQMLLFMHRCTLKCKQTHDYRDYNTSKWKLLLCFTHSFKSTQRAIKIKATFTYLAPGCG